MIFFGLIHKIKKFVEFSFIHVQLHAPLLQLRRFSVMLFAAMVHFYCCIFQTNDKHGKFYIITHVD